MPKDKDIRRSFLRYAIVATALIVLFLFLKKDSIELSHIEEIFKIIIIKMIPFIFIKVFSINILNNIPTLYFICFSWQ